MADHQRLHLPAAGHQDTGARTAGNQGLDLIERPDVVQHDQHPAVGQQAAVERDPLVEVVGDVRLRDAQGPQEPAEHRLGGGGVVGLVVPPHIGEQQTVGEAVGDLVRPMDGQARLSHPRAAGDQPRRERPRLPLVVQEAVERGELRGPAAEVGDAGGQFDGCATLLGGAGGCRRGHGERGVVPQDRIVQPLQFGPRLQAEAPYELLPPFPERLHGLRPPADPVLGQHQRAAGTLAQRVVPDDGEQVRQEVPMVAEFQLDGHIGVEGGEPEFLQTLHLVLHQRAGHPRERRSPPQGERLLVPLRRIRRTVLPDGLLGPRGELLELDGVDVVVLQREEIPRVGRDDDVGGAAFGLEPLAQRGDADRHLGARGGGRPPVPHGLHQCVDRDNSAGIQ